MDVVELTAAYAVGRHLATVEGMCDDGRVYLPEVPLSEGGKAMLRESFDYLLIRAMGNEDERALIVPALSACHLLAVVARSPMDDLVFMKDQTVRMIDGYHNGDALDVGD